MKKTEIVVMAALMMVVLAGGMQASAATLDSNLFPYKYEGGMLPTAAGYSYVSNSGTAENDFASVSNGVLKLDTDTNAAGGESAWYTLAGGTGTPWDAPYVGPCTMEVRMRSLPNNSGTYNAWFYWFDGNSAILLQVWHNKAYLNGIEVLGLDNQTDFHNFRIVSEEYASSADQRFDLYRDGVLIVNDAPNYADYRARQVMFGDMTGAAEVNVEIDYIRWDDQNAWLPVPEPASLLILGAGALLLKRRGAN